MLFIGTPSVTLVSDPTCVSNPAPLSPAPLHALPGQRQRRASLAEHVKAPGCAPAQSQAGPRQGSVPDLSDHCLACLSVSFALTALPYTIAYKLEDAT